MRLLGTPSSSSPPTNSSVHISMPQEGKTARVTISEHSTNAPSVDPPTTMLSSLFAKRTPTRGSDSVLSSPLPPPLPPIDSSTHPEILFRICTPYKVDVVESFLIKYLSFCSRFSSLPAKLRQGFNMGDFPPLTSTVIWPNGPSADEHRDFLDEYFAEEVESGRMSGPFSREVMEGICGGHFRSSPLSIAVSYDDEGNMKRRLCCNYSKGSDSSPSLNSYVDPEKSPTCFDSSACMAEIVSYFSLWVCLRHPHFTLSGLCCSPGH